MNEKIINTPEEEPGPIAAPEDADAGEEQDQEQYEGTPEELTSFPSGGGPPRFDRKKVMLVFCACFSFVVIFGLVFSTAKDKKKKEAEARSASTASSPTDFLQGELNKSYRRRQQELDEAGQLAAAGEELPSNTEINDEQGLPKVETVLLNPKPAQQTEQPVNTAPPPQEQEIYSREGGPSLELSARFSPMVPSVEGSLFSSSPQQQGGQYPQNAANNAGQDAYADYLRSAQGSQQQPSYAAQNNQSDKSSFYNSSSSSSGILAGNFLQADILWIGTIIPAVLETAINTDLPGNVIARVTQNIYDSHTGKKLLIPQGTLLVAKYNNSISYAQKRIQIVWDLLIRPDGYQLELEGMNGVDPKGMAGLKAKYNENWFEYVKAAGIITMFSLATSKIAEQSAKYGSSDSAQAAVQGNAQFVQQMGSNIVNRAMDIQPTLTVPSGEKIIIMLNKNVYFPPMPNFPVAQKYTLK
jgi:type IV secretion system protein VirB10